ncbi:MAG: hypothetical protein B6D58_09495 [candidate division Zixibacteria bacterium 4484_95]|nr:MAG: hypothetical protein B6D58_09495 [candidate division Zixibacteria bacterium 4484_95]
MSRKKWGFLIFFCAWPIAIRLAFKTALSQQATDLLPPGGFANIVALASLPVIYGQDAKVTDSWARCPCYGPLNTELDL